MRVKSEVKLNVYGVIILALFYFILFYFSFKRNKLKQQELQELLINFNYLSHPI